MQARKQRVFGPFTRIAVLAAGVLTLSFLAAPENAFAENRIRRSHRHHGIHRRHHLRRHHPRPYVLRRGHRHFIVPRRIPHRHLYRYRPYFLGPVYFAPHHHHHMLYRFPVFTGAGLVYRPYFYCGDHLFVTGYAEFQLPHFGISVAF